jgi:hypothetical protein
MARPARQWIGGNLVQPPKEYEQEVAVEAEEPAITKVLASLGQATAVEAASRAEEAVVVEGPSMDSQVAVVAMEPTAR